MGLSELHILFCKKDELSDKYIILSKKPKFRLQRPSSCNDLTSDDVLSNSDHKFIPDWYHSSLHDKQILSYVRATLQENEYDRVQTDLIIDNPSIVTVDALKKLLEEALQKYSHPDLAECCRAYMNILNLRYQLSYLPYFLDYFTNFRLDKEGELLALEERITQIRSKFKTVHDVLESQIANEINDIECLASSYGATFLIIRIF